jgi:hypothetical protein
MPRRRRRPRCLDLYCGGFGAGEGYRRAGYDVIGVDEHRRRNHPPGVEFIKADVLDVLDDLAFLRGFDLIHASPPCKELTRLTGLMDAQGRQASHPDLLVPTRQGLDRAGVPYVIENVEQAKHRGLMTPHVTLCGSMFDLRTVDEAGEVRWLQRHRLFELGGWGRLGVMLQPFCAHPRNLRPLGIYSNDPGTSTPGGGDIATLAQARELMDIDWMSWRAITQAIPPAYTEFLGRAYLEERQAA